MRFESVTAHAFGPFQGRTLTLAPGMNVVFGPNEAGKSTWHAALYAGLCGMRRARGQPRREDREFERQHRPWDGESAWEVGAIVFLEDGRRVELRHDLAGRVDSSARDVDVAGRDYSNEIMHDGAPDGSRWLGLDRRSFLSTACVRQANILGVLDDANTLQDELQRAAATSGTDATAAEALNLLHSYYSQNVGSERAWTRPLPTSRDQVATARRALDGARTTHEKYLERHTRVEQLEEQMLTLEGQADAVRTVLAETVASRADLGRARAQELSERFPKGPPRRPSAEDQLAQDVAATLEAWRTRPEPRSPSGPTIPELERRLAEINKELVEQTRLAREPRPASPTSVAWPLLGASGVVASIWLAGVGLVVPGAIAFVLGLGLLAWWAVSRRWVPPSAAPKERRRDIEHMLENRRGAEREYEEDRRRNEEVLEVLRRASIEAGLDADGPEQQVKALLNWQARRREELKKADREREDWDELQRLLGERSLDEIEAEAENLRAEAEVLAANFDAAALAVAREQESTDKRLRELQRQASDARDKWSTARGELAQFARDIPSVANVEETLAVAERELERVERLDRTLRTTIEFLKRAEERVHRDIAPVLRQTLLEWWPRVTGGRYTDCRVDPESLAVEVSGPEGRWRKAELLSHGAAEQLYLLLRLALARHLTKPGEICPLILDDVAGACDSERKRAVLDTLLAISESVQVILFTHEDDVREWAQERLSGSRNLLTELDSAGVPA